ncbi:MAG: NADH:flavin oxidoreductase [Sphaerochaetaceae bacterium]|nr:NADH:flavin oxidoreductase [Sphaerochaetaceae bacterium]MDC7237614.1 NADH:flavin oxidoreductase [Sphaerochaetaceae bacterium]MDC7251058.1 NADH:flavin oxidoreductase [Sphaerochaetaceae bacterium]
MLKENNMLFSPMKIGNRTAQNRFVAQPMEGNDAINGKVSQRCIDRYTKLAKGNWGVIVIEALTVSDDALARKNQMIINRENLPGFKTLVSEMRKADPNVIILFQITHSGRKSGKDFSRPTALYDPAPHEHLLTTEEIDEIQRKFVEVSLLSEEAGADGVDFKMCHGYFGCELLRPANQRDDKWGGSFENRTRFLTESVKEIKSRLKSDDFIIGSRISYWEGIKGGCGTKSADDALEDLTEMDEVIKLMVKLGCDYVNVSAGIPGLTSEITRPTNPSKYFYLHQFRYARHAKSLVGNNMKVFGSAYSVLKEEGITLAEENLQRGDTDFVGWGRQTLADPLFPKRVANDEKVDYCKVCSGCSRLMIKQEKVECIIYPSVKK